MKIKNSNKVLILMLILIIGFPIITLSIFGNQLLNGTAKLVESHLFTYAEHLSKNDLKGVKAIKFYGNDNFYADYLKVNVKTSDNTSYEVKNYNGKDSLQIKQVGDTLVFRFLGRSDDTDVRYGNFNPIKITVNLSKPLPIYASRASIIYLFNHGDSAFNTDSEDKLIHLENGSVFTLGKEEGRTIVPEGDRDTTDIKYIHSMKIFADNSNVYFEQAIHFDKLQLEMKNGGNLVIDFPFETQSIQGYLSGATKLQGSYNSIKELVPIMDKK